MQSDNRSAAATANIAVYESLDSESYADGAPHIKHEKLRRFYARLIARIVSQIGKDASSLSVLDLGAGEGSVTLQFLKLGARVTAVDSSQLQLSHLNKLAGAHGSRLRTTCGDALRAVSTEREAGRSFDLVVCNSFLHHIPDYIGFSAEAASLVAPGGVFFTFQDPIRFSSLGVPVRLFTGIAYFAWRILKPDVIRGLARRARRTFGIYDPESPEDNAEYHAVRDGLNEVELADRLRQIGLQVQIFRYFSTQNSAFQQLGDRLGIANTFALIGHRD
jgi:SAM-dependent methyltransferase